MNGDIVGMIPDCALYVKILVDLFKLAVPTCRSLWPALVAFIAGPVILFLLLVSNGVAITPQSSASAVLAGLSATGIAMGATALHKAARPALDRAMNFYNVQLPEEKRP